MENPDTQSQQISTTKLTPIVFKRNSLQCDTLLDVAGQEFHVHSFILKYHSSLFARFMDAAESMNTLAPSKWTYEYILVADDENDVNTWGLSINQQSAAYAVHDSPTTHNLILNEQLAYKNFLRAMYGKEFVLNDLKDFARLAEFYGALTTISPSVDSLFVRNPAMYFRLAAKPIEMATFGLKLQNKHLYKEAVKILTSQINDDTIWASVSNDKRLLWLVTNAMRRIAEKLAQANYILLVMWQKHKMRLDYPQKFGPQLESLPEKAQSIEYLRNVKPSYYRFIWERIRGYTAEHDHVFERLLENNLTYGNHVSVVVGSSTHKSWFLCTEIGDEDLPWYFDEKPTDHLATRKRKLSRMSGATETAE